MRPWLRRSLKLTALASLLLALALTLHGRRLYLATLFQDPGRDLQVEGPRTLVAGGTNVFHCSLLDRKAGVPIPGVEIEARVTRDGKDSLAGSATTDEEGACSLRFDPATVAVGKLELVFRAAGATDGAGAEVRLAATAERPRRILLVTDKPLYQPEQIVHLRACVMDTAEGKPAAGEEVTFEVEDPKGNKVFRRSRAVSRFGLAAVDFPIADEVNLGAYKIRARAGGVETEKTVTVDRYVLPKFKIEAGTDRGWYLAGETLKGSLDADYFFGKPVAGAKVEVEVARFVERFEPVAVLSGTTDGQGRYDFEFRVESGVFPGSPLDGGNAILKLEARVTDGAGHTEKKTVNRTVAAQGIRVQVVHESGVPVPGVPNRYFVSTAYPDGRPVPATVTAQGLAMEPREVRTSEVGVGVFTYIPPATSYRYYSGHPVVFEAQDAAGNRGRSQVVLERPSAAPADQGPDPERARRGADGVARFLLRTDRAFYRAGETLHVTLHGAEPGGRYHVDLVRNGQTVLTKRVKASGTEAALDLDLDGGHAGTVHVHAYRLMPDGHWARDRRVIYVDQPRDLDIVAALDQESYRPGATATVRFEVKDAAGRPEPAALSLAVVDEAVFALSENQPGLEKVYFSLEQEILAPKAQVKFAPVSLPALVREGAPPPPPVQEAAVAALAAIPLPPLNDGASSYDRQWERYQNTRWDRRRDFDDFLQILAAIGGIALLVVLGVLVLVLPGFNFKKAFGGGAIAWWIGAPVVVGLTIAAIALRWVPYRSHFTLQFFAFGTVLVSACLSYVFRLRRERSFLAWGGLAATVVLALLPFGLIAVLGGARAFKASTLSLDTGAPAGAADRISTEFSLGAMGEGGGAGGVAPASARKASVRVREWFPETLFWLAELITDDQGKASVTIPLADSITTWRMSAQAVSAAGRLGGRDSGIRVFQDFFVDLDLPVSLTQGDEVHVPVAVYNYLKEEQTVELSLEPAEWFECLDEPKKTLRLAPAEVGAVHFGIRARAFGSGTLTVFALGSRGFDDAVRRSVRVLPDGEEIALSAAGRLGANVVETLTVPEEAIDGATGLWFKLYPGTFSQVVDGLESMIRMPHG